LTIQCFVLSRDGSRLACVLDEAANCINCAGVAGARTDYHYRPDGEQEVGRSGGGSDSDADTDNADDYDTSIRVAVYALRRHRGALAWRLAWGLDCAFLSTDTQVTALDFDPRDSNCFVMGADTDRYGGAGAGAGRDLEDGDGFPDGCVVYLCKSPRLGSADGGSSSDGGGSVAAGGGNAAGNANRTAAPRPLPSLSGVLSAPSGSVVGSRILTQQLNVGHEDCDGVTCVKFSTGGHLLCTVGMHGGVVISSYAPGQGKVGGVLMAPCSI